MVWIAVLAALTSAAFLALGTQRQAVAVRNQEGTSVSTKGILRLLKNPTWLLGLALMLVGMGLNVAALAMAPLTVVQPLGGIALVLTTIINSQDRGIRINARTWQSIAVCTAGSIAFVLLAVMSTHESSVTEHERLTVITLLALAVLGLGAVGFVRRKRRTAPIFYILGAGILFGFTAVLVRTIAVTFLSWDGAESWWTQVPWGALGAIVVAGLLGQYFNQHAYASGPPELVIAGLTVVDPMVGVLVGITVLGELSPHLPWYLASGMAVAGSVAIIGVLTLSRHHPDVVTRGRRPVQNRLDTETNPSN